MISDVSPGELTNERGTNSQQPQVSDAHRPGEPLRIQPPPLVKAPLPPCVASVSPLETEKAWCSQVTSVSSSQGLGTPHQLWAAPLPSEQRPIMPPHTSH